jgi:anti-sigma regulatory factor (Ser/Thr protein kinase)
LTFEDDGIAFDPRTHRSTLQLALPGDMPIGGLGLALVKSFVAHIDYERTEQHAVRVTGCKTINAPCFANSALF